MDAQDLPTSEGGGGRGGDKQDSTLVEGEKERKTKAMKRRRLEIALERLGQILLGLWAADLVSSASGKAAGDVIEALQQLPGGRCRVVQMYVLKLAGGGGPP